MKYLIYTLSSLFILTVPILAFAAVETFQHIPFVNSDNYNTQDYVNSLYQLAIVTASFLVVIRLVISGFKYMFSDVITNKKDAINDIRSSLFGLLIVLGAVTILNTINPDLIQLNFLRNAENQTAEYNPENTNTRTETRNTNSYTDALSKAEACGGSVKKISNGNFTYTCPTTNNNQNTTQPRIQVSGWPVVFNNSLDAGSGGVDCRSAGGTPETETVDSIPVKYKVNCYSSQQ